ncbi:MAG: ArnT family glycosyltransferase [Bacteroidia bacterium]
MKSNLNRILFRTFHSDYFIGVAAFLIIFVFTESIGFNGLYGQDAHEYLRYSKSWHNFLQNGENPGDYFWPLYYPIAGALLSFLSEPALSLQLISVFSFSVSIIYLGKILRIVQPAHETIIRWFLLLFILSPFVLRAAMINMSDMFCLMFIVCALYHFIKFEKERENRHFLFFILLAVAAIMTRYPAFVVLSVPLLYTSVKFLQKFSLRYLLLVGIGSLFLILPHLLVRKAQAGSFIHHAWIEDWSVINFFKSDFNTVDGKASYRFPNIIYAFQNIFHHGFIFIGILLLPFVRIKDMASASTKVLATAFLLYGLFLAGIPFQNQRFLLLSFPVVLVLLFPAFSRAYPYLKESRLHKFFLFSFVVLQLLFFHRVFNPMLQLNRLEREIAADVKKYPGKILYTFAIDPALKSYGVQNPIISLWERPLYEASAGSLLLFNDSMFREQWHGKNPMNNWQMLNNKYQLTTIEKWPSGWELYEIR